MKTFIFLVCIAATFSASSTAATDPISSYGPTANHSIGGGAPEGSAPAAQRMRGKQTSLRAQTNLAGFKGTVVKEMRATKAFVKENVVKQGSADRKLMLLAAIGMIVLQLRRKHKSLPQRQIAPYA
jgi:hypothetical protein